MISIVVCVVMVLVAIYARVLGLPKLNVVSAFTASWVPMLAIAGVFGGASRSISDLTWGMILTGWGSLVIGAFAGWFYASSRATGMLVRATSIDLVRTRKIHLLLTGAFVVYVAVQLVNALPLIAASGGWKVIFSSGGNAYRNASLQQSLEQSQSALASNSLVLSAIGYATFIAGTVATYTGAVLWRAGYRLAGVLPVAVAAVLSLVTLQRTSVVLVCLLFFFGLAALRLSGVEILHRGDDEPSRGARNLDAPRGGSRQFGAAVASVAVAAALVGFLYYATGIRGGRGGTAFGQQIGEYLVGGVAGLDSRNLQGADWPALPSEHPGSFDPSPGMGGYNFSGLWAMLSRLGVPVDLTRSNLDFTHVELYGRPTITNVVTAFGEYYLDFRWVGLVMMPFLLGWATSSLQRGLAGSKRIRRVPVVAYLLTISFWSYFVSWFSDLRQLLVAVLGGVVLVWAVRGSGENVARTARRATDSASPPK